GEDRYRTRSVGWASHQYAKHTVDPHCPLQTRRFQPVLESSFLFSPKESNPGGFARQEKHPAGGFPRKAAMTGTARAAWGGRAKSMRSRRSIPIARSK
ncbi:MAG: hypothetical protein IKU17_00805, partial [Clostridia bacterium]|nr:hypothetical protein [Clostridia bacterium]